MCGSMGELANAAEIDKKRKDLNEMFWAREKLPAGVAMGVERGWLWSKYGPRGDEVKRSGQGGVELNSR